MFTNNEKFQWKTKYWLVIVMVACAVLLMLGSEKFLVYSPNIAFFAGGLHALNFLITLTK